MGGFKQQLERSSLAAEVAWFETTRDLRVYGNTQCWTVTEVQSNRCLVWHYTGVEKVRKQVKGMLNRFIAFCFEYTHGLHLPLPNSFCQCLFHLSWRNNICNKGKWNIPFRSAHCVLISCLECYMENIWGPFIFSPILYGCPNHTFTAHTAFLDTNPAAASSGFVLL